MPYRPREATCATCGGRFEYAGPGQLPRYCDRHKATSNRARQAREARARGEHERARVIEGGAAGEGADDALEAMAPLRVAALLSLAGGDPQLAARMAGLGAISKRRAAKLKSEAERLLPGLETASGDSLQRLGYAAVGIVLLNSIAGASSVPPAQRTTALRAVGDMLEKLQVSIKPTFTSPTIVWDFGKQSEQ